MEPYAVADAMRDYSSWYKARIVRPAVTAPPPLTSVSYAYPAHIRDASHRQTPPQIKWLARGSGERTTNAAHAAGEATSLSRSRKRSRNTPRGASPPPPLAHHPESCALNKSFADGKVASDDAWRQVKPFRDVDSARVRYLTDDECRRLVNACDADFRLLVQAALLTGCRYGELVALRTADFNADVATLRVPQSKKWQSAQCRADPRGRYAFFARQAAREGGEALLLPRRDGSRGANRTSSVRWCKPASARGSLPP